MRRLLFSSLLVILAVIVTSCTTANSTVTPTWTEVLQPLPTSTPIYIPTKSPTNIMATTLDPKQAKESIEFLMRKPADCETPCFWGIFPEITTINEAKNLFDYLALEIKSTTQSDKDFYGVTYDFDSGLSVMAILTVQDEIVQKVSLNVSPEKQQTGISREWLAYSPETLINQYGLPSKVDFFVEYPRDVGAIPYVLYNMVIYYDAKGLIIEYDGGEIDPTISSFKVCPLIDQFDLVRIWFGKNPDNPPHQGVTLEDATSITMKDFATLMAGNPESACFELKGESFP